MLDQPRSSQRYEAKPRDDERSIGGADAGIGAPASAVRLSPDRGACCDAKAWRASDTRVYRLWRREGLKVPQKKRKRGVWEPARTAAIGDGPSTRTTSGAGTSCSTGRPAGSPLKWLSIVDEYTRECLALKVDRSITSEDVIDTLAELFAMRGVPRRIRSDNGPEFIAQAIRRWLGQVDVETLVHRAGQPLGERLRRELPQPAARRVPGHGGVRELGRRPGELTAAWREDYNHHRPHSSLGYVTPAEFAARCAASAPATPSLQQHSGTIPNPYLHNPWYRKSRLVTSSYC